MSLEDLYREVITSHQKHPRHHGELEGAPSARRDNASCGDHVRVWVRLDGDRLADVTFTGRGCAISQASASMMTAALRGLDLEGARSVTARFRAMVMGEAPPDPEVLGDLVALSGVSKLHARRKCALLAWQTLEDALASSGVSASG
ncbi:Fe-S cluster assembly sulfur transfer protein SufU [Deinococcus pimensis]|uniref:Fe-S cluster assembly sulfur transfer protein SufU n=1 Tax=Deinococcus pimensis TaxID=309888 RepID=UPI00048744C8|nr:SUF system NifU family Fe-S cluster assembly protein [Deinococcus pimensis]